MLSLFDYVYDQDLKLIKPAEMEPNLCPDFCTFLLSDIRASVAAPSPASARPPHPASPLPLHAHRLSRAAAYLGKNNENYQAPE